MLNKAMLIGHLGRDPEVRYTQSGMAVTSFSVATTMTWKKDGEKKDKTNWHNVTAFGRLAEVCGEYLKKGSKVYVEGRLQTDSYEDRDGVKRSITKVILQNMEMLGNKGQQSKPSSDNSGHDDPVDIPEDDIPF